MRKFFKTKQLSILSVFALYFLHSFAVAGHILEPMAYTVTNLSGGTLTCSLGKNFWGTILATIPDDTRVIPNSTSSTFGILFQGAGAFARYHCQVSGGPLDNYSYSITEIGQIVMVPVPVPPSPPIMMPQPTLTLSISKDGSSDALNGFALVTCNSGTGLGRDTVYIMAANPRISTSRVCIDNHPTFGM